jgi:hypothetical protein
MSRDMEEKKVQETVFSFIEVVRGYLSEDR